MTTTTPPTPHSPTVNPRPASHAAAHATTHATQHLTVKHHAETKTWQDHVPRAAVVHTATHANIIVASVATANIQTSPKKIDSGIKNTRASSRGGYVRRWAHPKNHESTSQQHSAGTPTPADLTVGAIDGVEWTKVSKGKNTVLPNSTTNPSYYIAISNAYSTLPRYTADPHHTTTLSNSSSPHALAAMPSTFKHKSLLRLQAHCIKRDTVAADQVLLDHHITWAEDERTAAAKADLLQPYRQALDYAHAHTHPQTQSYLSPSYQEHWVCSSNQHQASTARLPILLQACRLPVPSPCPLLQPQRQLTNAHVPTATTLARMIVTSLDSPSSDLPPNMLGWQIEAPVEDFPTSLMSVGKTADDGTVSIYTKDGVTIHKETHVLITCHGKPLLIGVRDKHGRYRIPLIQHGGQWQPRTPSKKAHAAHSQAKSVYELPSTEQAIKWIHAVLRSTWLKAIHAGNFVGWPLLAAKNIQKYYPNSVETPKGHLNQTRKNIRSTKPKTTPFKEVHSTQLRGHKVQDVYTKVYQVCDTIFTGQPGKFP
eukprot:CCRYP_010794-RA/>CCRYP_010794-RA protein AED:0.38 eAED:0.53 QI:0/0/0/1/0/0.2/5/0/538